MLELLRQAISSKQVIQLKYDPGDRFIEPHALGYGSDGQILLRAYQVECVSASGEHQNWKLFRVDRIEAADANGESFKGPREGYKRGDRHMKGGIIIEL